MTLKGTRRRDWMNYVDPKDQERVRQERWYKISRSLDVCVSGDGRVELTFSKDHGYMTLSRPAQQKLLKLLQGQQSYACLKCSGKSKKEHGLYCEKAKAMMSQSRRNGHATKQV